MTVTSCYSLKNVRLVKLNTLVFILGSLLTINNLPAEQLTAVGYNTVSIDRLMQLQASAEQLHDRGQLDEALSVYNELFLSVRLNNGLFAEQQLMVLDRLMVLNIDRKDWDSLNQHLNYHEWLSNRLFSDNPIALAEQLQVNSLHRHQAANRLEGPQRSWHLVQARTQLWRAVSALESLPNEDGRLPHLWLQIANYHYALTIDSQRWLTSFENRSDEPAMISGWALRGNEVEQRSYEIGSELHQKISTYYRERQLPHDIDRLVLEAWLISLQGDWELLFDRHQKAIDFYQQALRVATQTSCSFELRDVLFGNAVGLPVTDLDVEILSCEQIRNKARDIDNNLVSDNTGIKRYRPQLNSLEESHE